MTNITKGLTGLVSVTLLLMMAGCGNSTTTLYPVTTHTAKGYAVGVGCLFYTEDGATWKAPDDPAFLNGKSFTDVSAVDSQCAWAVASTKLGGVVFRTLDGGKSWNTAPLPPNHWPTMTQGIKAITRDVVWVVGDINTIALTKDGGVTWQEFNGKFDDQNPAFFQAVSALDDQRAWGVGVTRSGNPYGVFTTNGGATWTPIDTTSMTAGHDLHDVSAVDGNTIWVAQQAPGNGVYLSTDGGKTFTTAYPDPGTISDVFSIIGLSSNVAFAGFENSSIQMTFDGGRDWAKQNIDGRLTITGLTIAGSGIWAAGTYPDGDALAGEGAILYSGNGGISWTKQTPTGTPGLTRVSFVGGHK